jgi:hypothetical protein
MRVIAPSGFPAHGDDEWSSNLSLYSQTASCTVPTYAALVSAPSKSLQQHPDALLLRGAAVPSLSLSSLHLHINETYYSSCDLLCCTHLLHSKSASQNKCTHSMCTPCVKVPDVKVASACWMTQSGLAQTAPLPVLSCISFFCLYQSNCWRLKCPKTQGMRWLSDW